VSIRELVHQDVAQVSSTSVFRLFALFFSEAVIVARANASQNFSDEKPDDQAGINNQQTEKGRRWITR